MIAPLPDADVLLDLYGRCAFEPCPCLQEAGRCQNAGVSSEHVKGPGRKCENWRPNGATSYEELIANAKNARDRRIAG